MVAVEPSDLLGQEIREGLGVGQLRAEDLRESEHAAGQAGHGAGGGLSKPCADRVLERVALRIGAAARDVQHPGRDREGRPRGLCAVGQPVAHHTEQANGQLLRAVHRHLGRGVPERWVGEPSQDARAVLLCVESLGQPQGRGRILGHVLLGSRRQGRIEDAFASSRPAWERAGALLVDDVEPYEAAKLRLLNATHSLLAYAGALAGHATIADAVHDRSLAAAAEHYMADDATPTLRMPAGFDTEQYRASVLRRFANSTLRHTTTQVAMDGSQKLPVRLLGVESRGHAQGRGRIVGHVVLGSGGQGPVVDGVGDRRVAGQRSCVGEQGVGRVKQA